MAGKHIVPFMPASVKSFGLARSTRYHEDRENESSLRFSQQHLKFWDPREISWCVTENRKYGGEGPV